MLITKIYPSVCFGAGKVHVYSDFDGTYCPARHSSLHNPSANPQMPEYCTKMKNFFHATNGDLDFHITTGRTYGEYESIEWLLKMRGYELPLPDSFIAKNGADEYLKIGTDEEFYQEGKFPYSYTTVNKRKEQTLKTQTKWDGAEIQNFIKKTAEKYNLPIVVADSENSVADYGERSLYSSGKLNANDWEKLPHEFDNNGKVKFLPHEKPLIDYKLGFRNDGDLKIHLIFTPDYGACKERNDVYDNFMNEIKSHFKDTGVDCYYLWEGPSAQNHYRTACSITPKVDDGELTKLFDTKTAVVRAKIEDDLIVIAGDGSNDFKMLNPLEYLDETFIDNCKKNSVNRYFYEAPTQKKLELLKDVYDTTNTTPQVSALRTELQNNDYLKKIDELPLVSIIIDKTDSKLSLLYDTFATTGKVIKINNGDLDIGIKTAITKHADKNKNFSLNMSKKFQAFIKGLSQKKNKYIGIIIGAAIVTLACCIRYIYKVKKEKNEN